MNIFITLLVSIISIVATEYTYANCQPSETAIQGYITEYNDHVITFIASNEEHTKYELSRSTISSIMQRFLISRINKEEIQVCIPANSITRTSTATNNEIDDIVLEEENREVSNEQTSTDPLSLSNEDLKYVKRSELSYLRQAIKDKAHSSSWRDTYKRWLRELIDDRKKCNNAYYDMHNGIEKTFRIFQGNLDWVKENGITGMRVTHMKIQGKSLMDIRNTATPQEIRNKIAQVQEHINNLKTETLRLASANSITDYTVIQKPPPREVPGVREFVWLGNNISHRVSHPWREYLRKRSSLRRLEGQIKTRRSSYPLSNNWGDVPLD